ncbi:cell surface glycoprotein 1 [Anguilla rostrata]|uniref:cell surface glycoprotein 1 n=1 Tax=Anguilla rostrata TaxID=7938 RepID=UPI0030D050CD
MRPEQQSALTVTILDLSQNALSSLPLHPYATPLPHLTHLHLGHNQLRHLSVCKPPPREEGLCDTWAPTLELLSAESNQLQHIPEVPLPSTPSQVWAAALHTLHLPHNRISTLQAQDLRGCAHLRELHLQHNLISTLAPLAFKELRELRVLDLSFNSLSTFPVPAYLSLYSFRTQVEVSGNPWRCDCRLRALSRWMGVAGEGLPWQVVCAEPPGVAGRDLLHLDQADLTCNTPAEGAGPHQEVTVHPGAEILLPCWVSDQDLSRAFWWTPDGSVRQASAQHRGGLLIQGIGEQDQGLYVCVSGPNQEPTSMFTVHVRARARGGAGPALRGGDRTHSDLALAVCLSVFLTFIAAFVLGALTRPLLDILWGKICAWRRPTDTPTATPSDNRGFSEEEESEQEGEVGREGLGETSMPYYITILPESGASQTRLGSRDSATEKEGHSGAVYENIPSTRGPAPQPVQRRGPPRPQGEGLSPWGGGAHDGSTGGDQSNSSSEEQPSHFSRTVEFEPIPDPQDLGIEQYSTPGSEQSNSDLGPDLEPDCDPDRDLGPTFGHDYALSSADPCPISREEFVAGWSNDTRPPGEDPFSAPNWTDSPWEPRPYSVQAPPTDSFPPDLDPELWNDSGESFEFTDSLPETATRGSFSLKEEPWSPFDQSAAGQHDSHDPTLLWEGQEKDLPPGLNSSKESKEPPESLLHPEYTALHPENSALHPENSALHPDRAWLDPENPESGELADAPQLTGGGTADAPWVIHEASQADVNMGPYVGEDADETRFESPGAWPLVTEDTEGCGLSPEVPELDPEPWPSLGLAQDPAGQDERFGGTDLLPPQHPTPADLPYPIKPRRSFNWHTMPPPPPPPPPPPQQEDTPTPPHPPPPQQEDTPTPPHPPQQEQEETPTAPDPPSKRTRPLTRPPQQEETPTAPDRSQQEDTPTAPDPPQGDWPMPVEGQLSAPSQGNLKQDWRRGGLFFQKKRAMDAFAPPSQAPPLPGSTHLPFGSVTVQTVTMAAGHSPSGRFPLREAEEGTEGGGEEGHVTSDPTSCFLFGSCQDKGSEA